MQMTTYGLYSLTPPPTDPPAIMQRADEVNAVLRMLTDKHTSAVILTGTPGVGKSILAALLYKRVRAAQQAGKSAPKHAVWLRLGTYTTLPDMIAAILQALEVIESDFFLLRPEQQISTLLRTLRRPGESALVVLDQFELLLHPETQHGVAGRGILQSFLAMLQTELGASRLLLTGYNSPFKESETDDTPARVRPYLVSRISLPEGVTLLQQQGVQGSPDDLSLLWQRCSGHVFALVLCGALTRLSG
ncbi:MAG: AAA family ATPase, partial [Ktedonobacteraceae bacterium]|nr:AAA family ATPase [Ktedonobacteraceae bacterium]